MKAQFKYAFLTGIHARGAAFAVIFAMNLVFIIFGSLGLLPFAAHVTAVSLGGVAIGVMMAFNIIGDFAIARRMFAAPGAYLYALTPVPRWKTLLASVITMAVLDLATMAVVITGEVWMSLNLSGIYFGDIFRDAARGNDLNWLMGLGVILLMIAGYLLAVMIILFSVTAAKSILYKKSASGFLAFLLACGCFYAVNLLWLIFAPFGEVWRFGIFITISIPDALLPLCILLTLLEAAGMFILTAKLMERKMNI